MNKLSEDESIKEILLNIRDYMQKSIDNGYHKFVYNDLGYDMKCVDIINAIEAILDLYQHKKGRIDELKQELLQEKEKNKWKPISEYNREKYDWVLVKYYDGDYECVPEVAEKRSDGKWYTSEKEIPFEVKYFFDIQELLEERN